MLSSTKVNVMIGIFLLVGQSNVGWISEETGETVSGDIVDREKIERDSSFAPDEQPRDERVPHGRGQKAWYVKGHIETMINTKFSRNNILIFSEGITYN